MTETPTKKKKIVKETRKIEKINKKPVEPLIGDLFSYFAGEVNYTLAGYVCKVLTSLLAKKPQAVLISAYSDGEIHSRCQ